jgi:hypothetical protein
MREFKTALVVASNREDQFRDFLAAWHGEGEGGYPWDMTILVQDGLEERWGVDCEVPEHWAGLIHDDWGSIGATSDNHFDLPDWLSRSDSGIKAWGFLKAVTEHGADVIITLDDDCMPSTLAADPSWYTKNPPEEYADLKRHSRDVFVNHHLSALTRTRKWTTTIPGFVPRGLPYGTPNPLQRENSLGNLPVVLNMGIWECIPDRDSVHELTNRDSQGYYHVWKPKKDIYRNTRVMSPQQYWPMCGMNLAFRREIAPLMYFPRMGDGTPFRRFDDIWCGVIVQKCLAHLGLSASVGKPMVRHEKASDPMDNLVRESPGIRANEEFWQIVDRLELTAIEHTPLHCMYRMGTWPAQYDQLDIKDPHLREYVPRLGVWVRQWCDAFKKAGWE